ncbi:TetR/AcrR family transcriptional regulator [Nocardioides luteus]|uniref:TetR/AcrR family transcriptional regulator n=1 Tax=Nocardioides luteus TaxID=1844 RepID=UPI002109DF1E|nr:TetR/AcrR family transcriptional regulator [Nocardioides luteus]
MATALKIVDEDGADALSLRVLAQRLDSSTATLYRHFSNRAELINQVIDHTFGSVPVQADELRGLGWEEACRAMATWMFENLRSHPNVAPLLLAQVPTGPNALALREVALQVLLDAGFSPSVAIRCYATLARFVLGFAIQLNGEDPEDAALAEVYGKSGENSLAATAAVAAFVPVPLDEEFRFGLDLLLTGLAQQRSRHEP